MKKVFVAALLTIMLLTATLAHADNNCSHDLSLPTFVSSWYEPSDLIIGCQKLVTEYVQTCYLCDYQYTYYLYEELDHQYYWISDYQAICVRCGSGYAIARAMFDNLSLKEVIK